jgi:hypothetical protein
LVDAKQHMDEPNAFELAFTNENDADKNEFFVIMYRASLKKLLKLFMH